MSDDFPPRLRTQPTRVGQLLEAAAHDAPSDAHVSATIAAVLATTSGAVAARAIGSVTWVKIAAGVIGLAGVVGAIAIHQSRSAPLPTTRESEPAASIVVAREPIVSAPPTVMVETPASVETVVAPPLPTLVTRGQQAHPPASDDSSMASELPRLVAIRKKMLAKDAAGALEGANAYERDTPNGSFVPEAEAMAIEALVDLGRTREAKTRADTFLARYGNSPQAARIHALTTR